MRVGNRFAILLLTGLVGCESKRPASSQFDQSTILAQLVATIGLVEGPEEYLFGNVSAVAADRKGRIYVADRTASNIRVYDDSGQFVAQIGRQGAGPGEFGDPVDIAVGPDNRLYVRETYRISVLRENVQTGIWDTFLESRPHQTLPFFSSRRGVVDSAGRYYDPNYAYPNLRTGQPPRYSYGIYASRSLKLEALKVPQYRNIKATRRAYYLLTENSGRLVRGLSHAPFEAIPAWAATSNGTIIGGDGQDYVLTETDGQGDTVRIIHGPRRSRLIPETEARDSMRALRVRIDTLPVPLSRVLGVSDLVRSRKLPDSLPAFIGVYVATDQSIWVEQWPTAQRIRIFDVLTPAGQFLRSVHIPVALAREPPPFFTHDAIYGVVRDSATDVQRVVKLVFR